MFGARSGLRPYHIPELGDLVEFSFGTNSRLGDHYGKLQAERCVSEAHSIVDAIFCANIEASYFRCRNRFSLVHGVVAM